MDIVEYSKLLVASLVLEPDKIRVSMFNSDENTKIIEIMVPDEDMKQVIGKNGENARSIRTLINAFAYLKGMKRVKVNIDAY